MRLQIVTPERLVFTDEVDAVYANASDGEVGILPKHIPLITPLEIGVLRYVKNGEKHPVAVMGGLLRTDGRSVTILSDAAEMGNEIDRARAEQAKQRAEVEMREKKENTDYATAERALARATTRLKAANR